MTLVNIIHNLLTSAFLLMSAALQPVDKFRNCYFIDIQNLSEDMKAVRCTFCLKQLIPITFCIITHDTL